MMIGSPSNLEVLLHSYYSPAPHDRHDAPAIVEGRRHLFRHGMIDREDQFCRCTAKGEYFISHLLSVPFPKTSYYIPEADDGE
jgi:hypothetical protein